MVIHSLYDESQVQFLTAWWGNGIALGFKGDMSLPDGGRAAIERCYNWAANTGVTRGSMHWLYDEGSIGYIMTCHADLLRGLIAQFRAETIMGREVPLLVDRWDDETESAVIEYDEPRILSIATEKANRFLTERVVAENFMGGIVTSLAPVYAVGHLARAGAASD